MTEEVIGFWKGAFRAGVGACCRRIPTSDAATVAMALVLLTFAVNTAARAQEVADTTIMMDPVEVSATPFDLPAGVLPAAVSAYVRSGAEVNAIPALSLEALTYMMPGLSVDSREHYALGDRITMRGLGWGAQFGVRGIQVFLDGLPLTLPDGQAMTYVIDPAFVRSVEVLRGPASTFWGNASGGVLYFSTRPPAGIAPQMHVRQMVGSYGLSKTGVQVTPELGRHRLSAYASYLALHGYRAHSSARLGRFGLTGDLRLGKDRGVRVAGAYVAMPRAQSPGTLSSERVAANPRQARPSFVETEAGKEQAQGQFGFTYYDALGFGHVEATAYGLLRRMDLSLPFAYITLGRRSGGMRVTLQHNEGPVRWGVGVAGAFQRDDRVEFENDAGAPGDTTLTDQLETVHNQAVFGRISLPLGPFRLSAGLRVDRLRFATRDRLAADQSGARTYGAVSPSLGLLYPLERARLYARFSTALEAPTTVELGNRPDGKGGFNPQIGPEHILGLALGAQGRLWMPRLSYDVALFGLQVRDLLVPYEGEDGETFYRNAGRTRHLGLEAAFQWDLTGALTLVSSYTYTHAIFSDAESRSGAPLDGHRVPGVPVHRVGGILTWRPELLWLALEYESTDAFFVNSENTARVEGYVAIDVRLSHPGIAVGARTTLTPFVEVNNVFDVRYVGSVVVNGFGGRYYGPAAGRHWRAGLAVQFG